MTEPMRPKPKRTKTTEQSYKYQQIAELNNPITEMKISGLSLLLAVVLCFANVQVNAYHVKKCINPATHCYGKSITCPYECPFSNPENPNAKACYANCYMPNCEAQCLHRKPNCNGQGAACYDPRFIGGDGIVYYFHGKNDEHFSLVSDKSLQINARFIGYRPQGRVRDFTWIQALGLLFKSHALSLEATKAVTWDSEIDHLKFTYNGDEFVVPEGYLSTWSSPEEDIKIERIADKNGAVISLKDSAEISVTVVPVTKEDDRIHKYQVPSDDCFAHLEVQFRFFALSPNVEGVLGRTYQPDYVNPAKPGVAMSVMGGEDKYRTSSLLTPDCQTCGFVPGIDSDQEDSSILEYGNLDCTRRSSGGYGIVFNVQWYKNKVPLPLVLYLPLMDLESFQQLR